MIDAPVAIRKLIAKGRRAPVVVQLGSPKRQHDDEWSCPYFVGVGRRRIHFAYGVDAFQSLYSALAGIYRALETSKLRFTNFAEPGVTGVTGFVPILPHFMGKAFFRKLDRLVEQQIAGFTRKSARRRATRPVEKSVSRSRP